MGFLDFFSRDVRKLRPRRRRKTPPYHGGCHGCMQDKNRCEDCQFYDAEWDKPDLKVENKNGRVYHMEFFPRDEEEYHAYNWNETSNAYRFHGCCHGCTSNDTNYCKGCENYEANWSLPDKNTHGGPFGFVQEHGMCGTNFPDKPQPKPETTTHFEEELFEV